MKLLILTCLAASSLARADSGTIETLRKLAPLFEASLEFFNTLQRTSKGLYRDSYLPKSDPKENRTCSSAAVWIGLMGLCMEHQLGRDEEAAAKALQTLLSLNGKVAGFVPPSDSSGFFRHFFDSESGKGTSEFSTIDTAIMVVGALYCRNTFNHPAIRQEADQLWSSFTIQFPFYMSQPGCSEVDYTSFAQAQAQLDQRISSHLNGSDHLWGCGAGITPDKGYLASNFDDNPGKMVSPHIIAGFLPVSPIAQVHLLKLYSDPSLRLKTPAGEILPRFSVEKPSWRPPRIESIDYASMIFGLAAIHPDLGMEFFSQGDAIYVRAPVGLNSAACL